MSTQPTTAYSGDDAYAFVCYSHADSNIVYPEIAQLQAHGVKLWYDEGISAGAIWREEIATAIRQADKCLFYISQASLKSEHCLREIHYALDNNVEVLPIYLEDVPLQDELALALSRIQALKRTEEGAYLDTLLRALGTELQQSPVVTEPTRSSRSAIGWIAALTGVILVSLATYQFWPNQSSPNTVASKPLESPSIAVLPFANMSDNANQVYFAQGVAEEIISLLAKNPQLKVISRSSAFALANQALTTEQISEQLSVNHLLEGSVRTMGDDVRITAQLIHAGTNAYVWSETYDRSLSDVFEVQSDIAKRVAQQLNVTLVEPTKPKYSTTSPAYLPYSQARHVLGLAGTLENTLSAQALLDEATRLDPDYVPAILEQGRLYSHLSGHGQMSRKQARRLATLARQRVLSMEPNNARAIAWEGWDEAMYDGAFPEGIGKFERSLKLDPTNLDILRPLIPMLRSFAKYDLAIRYGTHVVERDPLCVICISNLAGVYAGKGQLALAEETIQRALLLSPDSVSTIRVAAQIALLSGDPKTALEKLEQSGDNSQTGQGMKALALQQLGDTPALEAHLKKLTTNQRHVALATYFVGSGNAAEAIRWLDLSREGNEDWVSVFAYPYRRHPSLSEDPSWDSYLGQFGLSAAQVDSFNFDGFEPPSA